MSSRRTPWRRKHHWSSDNYYVLGTSVSGHKTAHKCAWQSYFRLEWQAQHPLQPCPLELVKGNKIGRRGLQDCVFHVVNVDTHTSLFSHSLGLHLQKTHLSFGICARNFLICMRWWGTFIDGGCFCWFDYQQLHEAGTQHATMIVSLGFSILHISPLKGACPVFVKWEDILVSRRQSFFPSFVWEYLQHSWKDLWLRLSCGMAILNKKPQSESHPECYMCILFWHLGAPSSVTCHCI